MARAALSLPFSGLSGSLGGTTIVQRPGGPVVRERVYRSRTLTPAQKAAADRMRLVGVAWTKLDDVAFAAWTAYAETQAWRNPASGAMVIPKAFNLFSGLASKVRQIDPSVSLAGFMPPTQTFGGDGVVVHVSPSSSGSSRRGGRGERSECEAAGMDVPPSPAPSSMTNHMEEGVLTFSADRPNAPGIVTELLIQPLANKRRAVYKDKYVSRGFVAFAAASLEATVEVPPGAYACAIRFVREATGQETAVVPLGVFEAV